MGEFTKVAEVEGFPDPGKQTLEVDERLVVLVCVDGQFHCIDDVCTHDGGPLGDGELHGCEIACPRHGARFDVRTGAALTMPATEATMAHEVKVEEGSVWVRIRED